jgi:uncharacterized protein DUF1579
MPRRPVSRSPVVLAALALLLAGAATVASPSPKGAAADADPGTAVLRSFVGVWNATMQIASPDDSPPLVISGIEVNALGGNGAWVTSDFRSQLDDRPFQGHAILAWNRATGRFRRVWADVTSPAFWFSEGSWDAGTRTLTLWVETVNSSGKAVRWHEETVFKDENTRNFTMYVPGSGNTDAAAITIIYRRRAEGAPPVPLTPDPTPPSPGHALVRRDLGAWSAQVENRLPAGGPPSAKGTETGTLCCGGNFVVTDFVGGSKKEPYAAHGLLGFDPDRKKYIAARIDTAGRSLEVRDGDYDAAGDTLTFLYDGPDGRGGTAHLREVSQWKGTDQRTLTVWMPGADGHDTAGLTMAYRRSRDGGAAARR